jgi:hypothetical protein
MNPGFGDFKKCSLCNVKNMGNAPSYNGAYPVCLYPDFGTVNFFKGVQDQAGKVITHRVK